MEESDDADVMMIFHSIMERRLGGAYFRAFRQTPKKGRNRRRNSYARRKVWKKQRIIGDWASIEKKFSETYAQIHEEPFSSLFQPFSQLDKKIEKRFDLP